MPWQPIATAPKDGTEIVVYCPAGTVGQRDRMFYARYNADDGCWTSTACYDDYYSVDEDRPTHWQPRLTPPTNEAQTKPNIEEVIQTALGVARNAAASAHCAYRDALKDIDRLEALRAEVEAAMVTLELPAETPALARPADPLRIGITAVADALRAAK